VRRWQINDWTNDNRLDPAARGLTTNRPNQGTFHFPAKRPREPSEAAGTVIIFPK
jgi:hypothetical protein